ncbi:hypothetical protein HPP92_020579 [Vanilla planifolia]|uniref:Uncharacterized protein n=1 Tax=Vanilla planifolia TaxID=51239 RepID=A0A835PZZ2_VANPL|nr:hypothetical protein HPP92_020579 [Vanilla planifolia]
MEALKAGSEKGAKVEAVISSMVMAGKPEWGMGRGVREREERSIEKEKDSPRKRTTEEARRGEEERTRTRRGRRICRARRGRWNGWRGMKGRKRRGDGRRGWNGQCGSQRSKGGRGDAGDCRRSGLGWEARRPLEGEGFPCFFVY